MVSGVRLICGYRDPVAAAMVPGKARVRGFPRSRRRHATFIKLFTFLLPAERFITFNYFSLSAPRLEPSR